MFYYITLMNENYSHPAMPAGAEEGIRKGMYLFRDGGEAKGPRVQLMGSGTILREAIAAADLLREDWSVIADIWSCTSFNELRREGLDADRWNMLHPMDAPRVPFVEQCLKEREGPVIAATDYMKTYAEQVRPFLSRRFRVLGTDGFGRSDYRVKLRQFFEVNRFYIAIASLKALADEGTISPAKTAEAIKKYGINPEKPNPVTV